MLGSLFEGRSFAARHASECSKVLGTAVSRVSVYEPPSGDWSDHGDSDEPMTSAELRKMAGSSSDVAGASEAPAPTAAIVDWLRSKRGGSDGVDSDSEAPAPTTAAAGEFEIIDGPHDFGFISVCLLQQAECRLPRLVLTGAAGHRMTSEGVNGVLSRLRATLDRREPLTITWDTRHFSMPSFGQIKLSMRWAQDAENMALLDELLQGICIILSNPVIRTIANFIVGALKPPQPLRVCSTEQEGIDFLRSRCQYVRQWAPDR